MHAKYFQEIGWWAMRESQENDELTLSALPMGLTLNAGDLRHVCVLFFVLEEKEKNTSSAGW